MPVVNICWESQVSEGVFEVQLFVLKLCCCWNLYLDLDADWITSHLLLLHMDTCFNLTESSQDSMACHV